MLNKASAKEQYDRWIQILNPLIGKKLRFSFGNKVFEDMVIRDITFPTFNIMKKAYVPNKRTHDGKGYTPYVISIVFEDDNTIYIVLEDAILIGIFNGVKIELGDLVITLELM